MAGQDALDDKKVAEIPTVTISCSPDDDNRKVGDILREHGFSRKLITRLKRTDSGITVGGKEVRTVDTVRTGDVITICESDLGATTPNSELNVGILYEDEHLIVFDKPPFMPCHESIKHRGDTLSNFFAAHCPNTVFRCVNRLDRDTSGCVVVAKSRFCANALQKCCEKVYFGITEKMTLGGGRICAPIAREQDSIIKRCVRADGQYAATVFSVTKRNGRYALCRFLLETGRTHQIRCHMAHIGCALVGDDMYGSLNTQISRQALHCGEIRFIHPITKQKLTITAPLPDDMKKLMQT